MNELGLERYLEYKQKTSSTLTFSKGGNRTWSNGNGGGRGPTLEVDCTQYQKLCQHKFSKEISMTL